MLRPVVRALFLCLLAAACVRPQPHADTAAPESAAALVSAGLAPLGRFVGDWEGEIEALSGNFRLARRVSWLVPDAWLLEQTVAFDEERGAEADRSSILYTYNPRERRLEQHLLLREGKQLIGIVALRDDGFTREVHPLNPGASPTLHQTSLFNGSEWRGRTLIQDGAGQWQETDRFILKRKQK